MLEPRVLAALGAPAIIGYGARTALGAHSRETFEVLRAGVGRLEECAFLRAKRTGAPITIARDSSLDPRAPLLARMEQMALSAGQEALGPWRAARPGLPIGVLLATPHPRPGVDGSACRQVALALLDRLGETISKAHCQLIPTGHEGGLAGLRLAARWLNAREIGACLVGGVESCVDLGFLDGLDARARLKGEDRPYGYSPGEGAGFLLLTSATMAKSLHLPAHAWLAGISRASEPAPWYSGQPSRSVGLTGAIAGLFSPSALRAFRTDVVYSDLNGEPWRADEWSMAYVRTADNQGEPLHMRHPADCWGDVGAASGPLLAAMATMEVAHPRMRSRSALVWTASDLSPARAAALIVSEEGEADR